MPTLDELRRWARGEAKVAGLPDQERLKPQEAEREAGEDDDDETVIIPSRRVDLEAMRVAGKVATSTGKYRVNADCTNAILGFGTYRDSKLSDLVEQARGRSYLRWIADNVKEDDLKRAAKHQLEAYRDRKRKED